MWLDCTAASCLAEDNRCHCERRVSQHIQEYRNSCYIPSKLLKAYWEEEGQGDDDEDFTFRCSSFHTDSAARHRVPCKRIAKPPSQMSVILPLVILRQFEAMLSSHDRRWKSLLLFGECVAVASP